MTTDSPATLPADASSPADDAAFLNSTLVFREDLTDELAVVKVLPDGGVPEFKPGQYATLGLPPAAGSPNAEKKGLARLVLRPYSISSSPLDPSGLEFYLAKVHEGQLTPRIWDLKAGDRLYTAPKPKGKFTLDGIPADRDLVMIATGTGLAPFMSIIKTYRETGRWRRAVVVHGTRFCADLGYRGELQDLASADPSIVYVPTCSREPGGNDWYGLRGRVNVAVEQGTFRDLVGVDLSPDACHVLLCGNPTMIDELVADLVSRGFVPKDREHPDGNLHFEKYW